MALNDFDIETVRMFIDKQREHIIWLEAKFHYEGEVVKIQIPLDKLGKRLAKEMLKHWSLGISCGTIKYYDCLSALLVFSDWETIFRYRTRIKNHIGLYKDEKLRNFAIWRKQEAIRRCRGTD